MSKINIFTPPEKCDDKSCNILGGKKCPVKLFLAGTIDNGDSDNWQDDLIKAISNIELMRDVNVYNPRREEWPSADNYREIDRQIEWELFHLEKADLIVMNILASSKSPISLMELGLFAKGGRLIVFCPKSFYRYDNVRVVCKRYGIPLFTTNNIEYIARKVCEYVGVDEEAEKEKRKASERESLLKMKENCKLPDGTTVKWYTELYKESKERFEKEFGEPLCLEEELNTET
jgi:hypothetical protein